MFRTGFIELDQMISELPEASLILLYGRPCMGKTSFALNICNYLSVDIGIPVVYFSQYINGSRLFKRMIIQQLHLDIKEVERGSIASCGNIKLKEQMDIIIKARMIIDDKRWLSIYKIKSRICYYIHRYKVKVIFIEFLKDIFPDDSEGLMLKMLKNLTNELNITIFVMSTLNRNVEKRHNKRPNIHDIKAFEPGALTEADLIMGLYREGYYDRVPDNKTELKAELIVVKNKNGEIGKINLQFNRKELSFKEKNPIK